MAGWRSNWGKRAAVFGAAAVVGITGLCIFSFSKNQEAEISYKETQVTRGNVTSGITESGSVTIGTVEQELKNLDDFGISASEGVQGQNLENASKDASDLGLEVEEVYLAVGETAKAGDAILKLDAESVTEYREALEDNCRLAELALSKAKLEAKTKKLNAKYQYDTNVAKGGAAQSEYDTTLAQLQASVDMARTKMESSADKIAEYQKKIAKGEKCGAALAEEQANYASLAAQLQSELNTQAIKSVEAKQKYEEALLNRDYAGSIYAIDTADVDSAVEEAEESVEIAQDALSYFQALVGDGTIYAQYGGTVFSIGYEEGDILSSSTGVAEFADSANVTITVSVSQEDISAIEVGGEAEIVLTAHADKTYEGTVKSVDTSSSSGMSTVSYDVAVLFAGDVSDVYQDMTGNVTFIASKAEDVCYVSRKAVVLENGHTYLKVKKEDGTIEKMEVVTGISDGIHVEIKEGVEEGSMALIESQVRSE